MLFAEEKSHTHTHTRTNVRCYLISIFDMYVMIIFVRDVIWICKDRINTQIPFFFNSNITQATLAIFAPSQTMPHFHPSVNTYHTKMIPNIWDKTLFYNMYNRFLFIDDFFKIINHFLGVNFLLTKTRSLFICNNVDYLKMIRG